MSDEQQQIGLTLEHLMSGLFLGEEAASLGLQHRFDWGCERVVKVVEGKALEYNCNCRNEPEERAETEGYDSDNDDDDDELEPADRWHKCLDAVRAEWELWKSECPSLYPWHRRPGNEADNRLHLEDVLVRLGDTWRARDYLLGLLMADREDEEGGDCGSGCSRVITSQECDLRPMALFMLAVVRAEELEAEALRVTRAVRARYGDAGLPVGLEGLLGGQRSLLWWMRETGSSAAMTAVEE